jgi:hypothetical protein
MMDSSIPKSLKVSISLLNHDLVSYRFISVVESCESDTLLLLKESRNLLTWGFSLSPFLFSHIRHQKYKKLISIGGKFK